MGDNPAPPPSFLRQGAGTKSPSDACPLLQKGPTAMLTTSPAKRGRNLVDISSKVLARYWCKRLKKSKPEIEAAIAKVGNNAETVMKELSRGNRGLDPLSG